MARDAPNNGGAASSAPTSGAATTTGEWDGLCALCVALARSDVFLGTNSCRFVRKCKIRFNININMETILTLPYMRRTYYNRRCGGFSLAAERRLLMLLLS